MKRIGIIIITCSIIFFVLTAGCLNLAITDKFAINKDAQISNAEYDMTMDCSTYNLLELGAKHEGYDSVKDAIEANLSKSLGSENVAYNEIWDTPNNKVTISISRTDTYSPPPDSKISIHKDGDMIVYQDNSFYSPEAMQAYATIGSAPTLVMPVPTPAPTSVIVWNASSRSYEEIMVTPTPLPTKWVWDTTRNHYEQVEITPTPIAPLFNAAEEQEMMQSMLSGITVDYYLEMPGKIVNTTATTVNANKAEWHFGGTSLFNTSIYAESDPPSISGFTSLITIIGFAIVLLFFGSMKKGSR
ncbi:MAG: hypothetical protein WCC86_03870 [Methanoregula sp.]|uniref:hypothetical protein n=1 Tax=Methanoregula sp. TaxID=2052170 RepID=UPI003BB18FC9